MAMAKTPSLNASTRDEPDVLASSASVIAAEASSASVIAGA
jgi:hypothetical protein